MTRPTHKPCYLCGTKVKPFPCHGCHGLAVTHACPDCHVHTRPDDTPSPSRKAPAFTRPPGTEPWMGPSKHS